MAALHNTQSEPTAPTTRGDQIAVYWHNRIAATLDRLEREARRMFQLESELSDFANEYYNAVGNAAERLTQVEQKLATDSTANSVPEVTLPTADMLASRDARDTRRAEIKTRYRSLAKEIHPDRAMVVEGNGALANNMHTLNAAYQKGDLAVLLKLEAQMLLTQISTTQGPTFELELALREVERAAETYAEGYRTLLHSPLNELMLRAMSARLAGWDWMQAVVRKVERTIEEKERAAIEASIAEIGAWRESVGAA